MHESSPAVIDLRSDTVTRPGPAMRRAMAEADVGDDVYGEDPTVIRLQERVAELVGKEAALFVPSGTMANQIALSVLTRPGDDVLVGSHAHNMVWEGGAAGALNGVQMTVLPGDGRFDGQAVRAGVKPDDGHRPPTRLVCVENTHNMCGGLVWQAEALADVLATAKELGLATHLDGARLWNAAAATGLSERELAAGFDTVSVCLSKGLGAPVGSLVCGSRELMRQGLRVRKRFGGAMRQAGILAAAGLYAIEHHRARLHEDHANAAFLAAAVAEIPGLAVNQAMVHTNIVMVDLVDARSSGPALAQAARARGLLCGAISATRIRLVTHLDVDRAACARAVEILAAAASELAASSQPSQASA